MRILTPEPKGNVALPRFKVAIPDRADPVPEHFPKGFPADYPAIVTDAFARDILETTGKTEDTFHVFIDLPEYLETKYPWLAFTFALHALILAPKCCVFFRGMNPLMFSHLIDAKRGRILDCIWNFAVYLKNPRNDRMRRVFEQVDTGSFVSFEYGMRDIVRSATFFAPYYESWLQRPYETWADNRSGTVYSTHPYDHLPVRNLTEELVGGYLTASQMKSKGLEPDIDRAILMHDQIRTVALRPYWPVENIN